MKKNPRLVDLIITWMKKELPKAKFEDRCYSRPGAPLVAPDVKRITIMKGKRECFKVEFYGFAGDESSMKISCAPSEGILYEHIDVKRDRVVFGKWNNGAEVLAADPEFFQKMTLYMTAAAMVVTMGDFSPNIPNIPEAE